MAFRITFSQIPHASEPLNKEKASLLEDNTVEIKEVQFPLSVVTACPSLLFLFPNSELQVNSLQVTGNNNGKKGD